MKLIFIFLSLALVSCRTLSLPQDPTTSTNEFDCSNKCAAFGMKGVFIGGRCGCEKR